MGILIAAYLDYRIIWAPTKKECLKSARKTIAFLESLGFKRNKKVETATSIEIRMAGTVMGSCEPYTFSSNHQKERDSTTGSILNKLPSLVPKEARKDHGLPPVCISDRPSPEGEIEGHKLSLDKQGKLVTKGQEENPKDTDYETETLVISHESLKIRSPPPPQASVMIHTDASLSGWGGQATARYVKGHGRNL